MTGVELRIELPAYSHSFNISVPPSSTIQQVKEEISRACPGQPRIDGQRLISKGRNLADDEKITDLWKAPSDSRILHLAVHPSAWKADPPAPELSGSKPPPLNLDTSPFLSPPSTFPTFSSAIYHPRLIPGGLQLPEPPASSRTPKPVEHKPMPYIVLLHQNAISALVTGNPPPPPSGFNELRDAAKAAVNALGWEWPSILDDAYPTASSEEGEGLKYERSIVHGRPYLTLKPTPNASPTQVQLHALHVLSYTFTLLEVNVVSSNIATVTTRHIVVNGNDPLRAERLLEELGGPNPANERILQELGLRRGQNNNNNNNNNNLNWPGIPLRPLLMPLGMLIFRAVLLLYFVGPVRKPVVGILIFAWVLYELWQPVRNLLLERPQQQQPANNAPNQNNGNNNPVPPNHNGAPNGAANANPPANGGIFQVQQAQAPGVRVIEVHINLNSIFNYLADLNLQSEQQILDQADQAPVPEPGIGHKIASFIGLFLGSLHPALWNRRRLALRRREGPIRTEANIRQQPDPEPPAENPSEEQEQEDGSRPGEQVDNRATEMRDELRAKHARRPEWVRRYIDRVVEEDWVDDAD